MRQFGFCDRCGAHMQFPDNRRVVECYPCELGMHSWAAKFDQRWPRAMTSAEIQLAHRWALIEGKAFL